MDARNAPRPQRQPVGAWPPARNATRPGATARPADFPATAGRAPGRSSRVTPTSPDCRGRPPAVAPRPAAATTADAILAAPPGVAAYRSPAGPVAVVYA